ncbi:D-alanyl-D-alanine carboxypeptidase family protein [Sphingomonas sp.]|jgi:D-alanyl-D-alanine carboxypeptidase (penicillin-binding protein 5/6)|uniref:D-alanyl-D-alanine carboxypeptidase family protein n=1 Tax=Sphingomonas sp. TaxID=28214 RepID=UPI002E343784|nr:D-alanyl-D-alanine carboxypeptidase family protein [Sphingomonas sp.]HEX4693764.1 D-alanyl-D-alanine carboxypeptidase family protein [Sphingomonas sp.]
MKKIIAFAAALALAVPAFAMPEFQTPAPVAYMVDLSSNAVLYSKDADRRMPPASLAKMMTVYVVFDMIKHGQLSADKQFTVRPETWTKWHGQGSTMFLSVNENVSVDNLLKGIVTLSGNDACVVIAEGISGTEQAFTDRMNDEAKKLGLTNSHFGTSNGWPDNGVTYVSARDMEKLAEATIRNFPDLYKRYYALPNFTWGKTLGKGEAIDQANRDPLLGNVAGADGLKTGHTDEAGYSFVGSAMQNGRRLILVIAGLDSFNHRKEESIKFMNWGFGAWSAKPIVSKGKQVATADVQLGSSSTVGLVAADNLAVTVPSGSNPNMTASVVYDGPLKAPIKAGDHVADLIVKTPGMADQRFPLVADKDVGQAGFFGRAWAGLMQLFG